MSLFEVFVVFFFLSFFLSLCVRGVVEEENMSNKKGGGRQRGESLAV